MQSIDKFVNIYQPHWVEETYAHGNLKNRLYVVDRQPIISIYIYTKSRSEEHQLANQDTGYMPDQYHRLDGPAFYKPDYHNYSAWWIGGLKIGLGETEPATFDAFRKLFVQLFPDWETKGFSRRTWLMAVNARTRR